MRWIGTWNAGFLRLHFLPIDQVYVVAPTTSLSLGAPYFKSFFQISRRFQFFSKCQKNGAITSAPSSSAITEEQKKCFFVFGYF